MWMKIIFIIFIWFYYSLWASKKKVKKHVILKADKTIKVCLRYKIISDHKQSVTDQMSLTNNTSC